MLFERIVEQATESIVITDLKGRIEYVNPFFEKMTGFTKAEAMGQNPRILKSGHQDPNYYYSLWQTISKGKTWQGEFINKKKNGELYFETATIFPIRNEQGKITHYGAVKRDITSEKRSEAERNRFVAVIEQMQELVLITDTKGRIEYVNPFFEKTMGYALDEIKNRNPRIFKSGETNPQIHQQLWHRLKNGKPWQGELINRTKQGTLLHLRSIIMPIRNEFGQITHYVDVKRDMTQEKQNQEKLEKNLEMLNRFKDATVDLALEMKELEQENQRLRKNAVQKTAT